MAYRAYIEAVQDNPTPAENINVTVRFEDAPTGRVFRKTYKYVSGTSREEFEAMVLADRQNLRALDTARGVLEAAIGTEVV